MQIIILRYLFLGCLVSFFVTCLLMPLIILISKNINAVSETGGRHVGSQAIGRLGGGAVVLGLSTSVVSYYLFDVSSRFWFISNRKEFIGVIIGWIFVGGIGFWDDISRLSPFLKLSGQIVGASITYFCGFKISAIDLPFLESFQLASFSFPVTVFWIVGIVNAINLIDGLDGLAGGVLLFASCVNLISAICIGSVVSAVLMVGMLGAIFSFLLFNWYPAKIYLGDGGAYSLGFILAVNGLIAPMQKLSTGFGLMVPILALGLPIFDTLLTILRRMVNNRKIFKPDRGHLHHILLDSGIGHRDVVVGLYSVSCCFCSLALAIIIKRNSQIGIWLILFSCLWGVGWIYFFRRQLCRVMYIFFRRY